MQCQPAAPQQIAGSQHADDSPLRIHSRQQRLAGCQQTLSRVARQSLGIGGCDVAQQRIADRAIAEWAGCMHHGTIDT